MRWKIDRGAISQSSAMPIISPKWIARALVTGSDPGIPRHTGQVRVLGSSPKLSSQPQNIFVRVASWTWISRPMTGSRFMRAPLDPSKPIACSSAWAASRIRFSLNAGPAIWKPTGRPSARPFGIETAGMPASDIGTVQTSFRYIASGSAVLAPSSNATPGAVGVTTKSNRSQARSKSPAISVRTFCARP